VADFYRMVEAGILGPDSRVELIDGEIIDMAPPGSLHAAAVNRFTMLLAAAAQDRACADTASSATDSRMQSATRESTNPISARRSRLARCRASRSILRRYSARHRGQSFTL
jgi:hypothetical protein